MGKTILQRLLYGVGLGLTTAIAIILITEVLFPNIFDNFEAKSLDLRYSTKIRKMEAERGGQTIDDIVVIDIDNRSLNKLGRFHQWPRDYYSQISTSLANAGVMVLGFDILFMEQDIDRVADTMLVRATKKAGNVVHALSFSKAEPDAFLYKMDTAPAGLDTLRFSYSFPPEIMASFPEAERFDGKLIRLYNASQKLGFANFQPDDDSVIRKMPLFMNFAGRLYPSLAMAMVLFLYDIQPDQIEIRPGKHIRLKIPTEDGTQFHDIPIDENGHLLVNYMGTYQTFRYVSFYDVYTNRIPPEFFEGKVVLVGASAAGLYDLRPVPFQTAFPGVEIHANILCNILTDDYIYQNSKALSHLFLILLCVLIGAIAPFFRMRINIPIIMLIAAGFIYYTFIAFENKNLWVENVRPVIGIIFCYISVISYRYIDEMKDKRKIKGMFQHYISATVVNELLKDPDMLKLGGERKVATAFFSDIKNFTTVSENLEPENLVAVLNEYLSVMTDIVLKYEGYLDKYEGDAIVSIFGIPVPQDDHAERACYAALDMQQELLELRKRWEREGKPLFEKRIGINSGPMIAGNIGSKNRFDYTAIGDSVNLASRLEGANKMYGTSIMISEDTFQLIHEKFWCRELDFIRVKGKKKPVRIYEVIGRKSDTIDPVISSSLEYFVKGLEVYRNRDWIHAFDLFQKALSLNPTDGPSQEFVRRCKIFIDRPRPADWDGVFELRSK